MDVYEFIVFGSVLVGLMISGYYQDKKLGHLELKIAILEGDIAELQGLKMLYEKRLPFSLEATNQETVRGLRPVIFCVTGSATARFTTEPPEEEAE